LESVDGFGPELLDLAAPGVRGGDLIWWGGAEGALAFETPELEGLFTRSRGLAEGDVAYGDFFAGRNVFGGGNAD